MPVAFLARHRRWLLLATAAWVTCGVLLYLWVPLLTPALMILGIVAPLAWYVADGGRRILLVPGAAIAALMLASAYLGINASWSLSPGDAHQTLGCAFVLVMVLHLLAVTVPDNGADAQRAMLTGLCLGVAIGGAVLAFEVLSRQWLHRTAMELAPQLAALRPKPRDMVLDGARVVLLQPYLVNRNIAALAFLFWPATLAVALIATARARIHILIAGMVPSVVAILGSTHATSKIALLGSSAVFCAATFWPALTRRAIAGLWVAALLLVVPLAALAYNSQLYLASWLPRSGQHRIVIWGHTSQLIAQAPVLGSGINTARALNEQSGYDAPLAPGSQFRLSTSLHSHNAYLQTWYEAGAVGAVLLLLVGLAVLGAIARAPPETQPYLYAVFAACALLGSSSFSLWQPWFMASFAFAAGFTMVGAALAQRRFGATGRPPPLPSAARGAPHP